jgi:hypothetical protein
MLIADELEVDWKTSARADRFCARRATFAEQHRRKHGDDERPGRPGWASAALPPVCGTVQRHLFAASGKRVRTLPPEERLPLGVGRGNPKAERPEAATHLPDGREVGFGVSAIRTKLVDGLLISKYDLSDMHRLGSGRSRSGKGPQSLQT